MEFKVKVVENIGNISELWFGKPGSIHTVKVTPFNHTFKTDGKTVEIPDIFCEMVDSDGNSCRIETVSDFNEFQSAYGRDNGYKTKFKIA